MAINKEIIINGKKIRCQVTGSGSPVLLVHGFGETGDVWKHQVEFLQDKFQLIVPDLPGSGGSESIPDMSMEGMAEVIKAMADIEIRQPFTLIGHSMGGYIALAFAEKYPSLLKAFGLFHSSAYADSEEKKATRRKGIEFIREHGAFAFLKTSTPNLFSPVTKSENQALIDDFIARLSQFSPESLIAYYEAMMKRPDRTAILKNTPVPVLFILGESDTAIPLADGLEQSHLPGISDILILRKSGHMGMLEETGKCNNYLQAFLSL